MWKDIGVRFVHFHVCACVHVQGFHVCVFLGVACVSRQRQTRRQRGGCGVWCGGVLRKPDDEQRRKREKNTETETFFSFSSVFDQAHVCKRTHKLRYTQHLSK